VNLVGWSLGRADPIFGEGDDENRPTVLSPYSVISASDDFRNSTIRGYRQVPRPRSGDIRRTDPDPSNGTVKTL